MKELEQEKNRPPYRFIHQWDERVPVGLRCPRCDQDHQIVLSRKQHRKGTLKRMMFYHFRCGVCDCRFRHPKTEGIVTFLFCGAAIIVTPLLLTWLSTI